jgi:hypothetical protein
MKRCFRDLGFVVAFVLMVILPRALAMTLVEPGNTTHHSIYDLNFDATYHLGSETRVAPVMCSGTEQGCAMYTKVAQIQCHPRSVSDPNSLVAFWKCALEPTDLVMGWAYYADCDILLVEPTCRVVVYEPRRGWNYTYLVFIVLVPAIFYVGLKFSPTER